MSLRLCPRWLNKIYSFIHYKLLSLLFPYGYCSLRSSSANNRRYCTVVATVPYAAVLQTIVATVPLWLQFPTLQFCKQSSLLFLYGYSSLRCSLKSNRRYCFLLAAVPYAAVPIAIQITKHKFPQQEYLLTVILKESENLLIVSLK